jgi:hypothetical protein
MTFSQEQNKKTRREKMKKSILILSSLLLLVYLSGCSTGGSFMANNVTNVELSEQNFEFVARNVEGFSRAEYVIGLSYSSGFMANTLALVRTGGSAKLYNDAIKNLWDNFRKDYGDTEGRNLLLANVRYDTDILNLLLYTQTDLYIHADIIEFEE